MAYGHVPAPTKTNKLQARLYTLPSRAITTERVSIVAWPIDCVNKTSSSSNSSTSIIPPALEDRLRQVFNDELEKGVTYPQRGPMSEAEFKGYFLSYDLIVGVLLSEQQTKTLAKVADKEATDAQIPRTGIQVDIPQDFFDSVDWEASYGFSYYIKVSNPKEYSLAYELSLTVISLISPVQPNYPGRSSHLCNGGFVVPPSTRGLGLGGIAALSFLYYGPLCGYKGSVFNLVYANNEASVRIWERLGFYRVGKIPNAGLLRTSDGTGEHYVDAWVIHGDFEKLGLEGVKQ
jgi:ribosomal protein S18 acetylase RimI-like enzyme